MSSYIRIPDLEEVLCLEGFELQEISDELEVKPVLETQRKPGALSRTTTEKVVSVSTRKPRTPLMESW